ncbi:crooked neck-like protein 1 [Silurus meridionalis]|uniref:crooked neck-like protein 1 n=1 Tax=Silurus meridionalis TaxID=175797 RepID=UPI001EEC7C07|nr:crooked neck-like protein 1 [Silurus meridionalis]
MNYTVLKKKFEDRIGVEDVIVIKRIFQYEFKVWKSYAQFKLSMESEERLQRCRQVYEEANRGLRPCEEKGQRLMLLKAWMNFEQKFGTSADKDRVKKLMPKQVDTGWEEYYDYIFLEDAANQPNLKLLSMAKMWKKQQQQDQDQEKQDAERNQSTEPTQPRDE